MNKISVSGRIGKDSELRFLANGDPVLSFSVADDVGYGEKKSTNWWNCSIFGKRGESLAPYTSKGQQVTVFGTVQLREYTTKDGIKATSHDIRVDEIALTGGKQESQSSGRNEYAAAKGKPNSSYESDIPF